MLKRALVYNMRAEIRRHSITFFTPAGLFKIFTTMCVCACNCESVIVWIWGYCVDFGIQINFSKWVTFQIWNSQIMRINYICAFMCILYTCTYMYIYTLYTFDF